jgi:hypothetical protein
LDRSRQSVRHRRTKYGIPIFAARLRPWHPEELRLLGKFTDAEVAARTGHPAGSVKAKRLHLGLPSPPRPGYRRWTPADDALLGTAMDKDIARRLGCSSNAVKTRRRHLGIPGFRNTHGQVA